MDDSPGATRTIGLDDPQQQKLHRREWVAERIGWALIAGAVGAALVGLLGPGWLSHCETSSAGGRLSAEYYAAIRYEAPAELRLRFESPPADADELHLTISRSFGDAVTTEGISPTPIAVEMSDENLIYVFRLDDVGKGGRVVLRFKPNRYGWLTYSVSQPSDPAIEISQFVLP